jgi:hypothetical protein
VSIHAEALHSSSSSIVTRELGLCDDDDADADEQQQ